MVARKRGHQEMEAVEPPREPTLLERIRNMWQFANLAQWIFTFGRAVKIDEQIDIEELEMECLKPQSTVLPEIGLALLKFVSSHRGLTHEIFDEYTRRQYMAKAPELNPFGEEEEPKNFSEFDVFTKIRVLQQLTQWTMINPDRIRERMPEQKDSEQTIWRIEPFGWDSEDRTYFVLDDNRLYRRTDPPPPPPPAAKPKKNTKKYKAAARASRRRRIVESTESEAEPTEDGEGAGDNESDQRDNDGLGGMTWECVAVTLDELNNFIASFAKTRDPNEKALRQRLIDEVLPILEKQEEARKRKAAQKERELINLSKLATAKRSSRIAHKQEVQKQEEEAREAERKKQAELAMAKKEQEKWLKLEKERESRMMTREQRLKEREARRILHEEELANLSEDSKMLGSGAGRMSERHLKAEIERKKQALEELAEEEDDWVFDCICGAYGKIDDGTHSIACEKCNIWQHSKCVGISQVDAERDDFHFICTTCKRRAEDEERAKNHPPIKIKIRPSSSSSNMTPKRNGSPATAQSTVDRSANIQTPSQQPQPSHTVLPKTYTFYPISNGHHPQISQQTEPSVQTPSVAQKTDPNTHPGSANGPRASPYSNGQSSSHPPLSTARPPSAHVFSSPHPESPTSLPPPAQSRGYSFTNGSTPEPYRMQPNSAHAQNHLGDTPKHIGGRAPREDAQTPSSASYGIPQSPQASNTPRHMQQDDGHRRSSINMQSPLVGTPMLTPVSKNNIMGPLQASGSSPSASAHQPVGATKSHQAASGSDILSANSHGDSVHASALPPPITGLSPTKHSPSRVLSTPNGSFEGGTPSVLPPVAPLSPSPQMQNLTPPVKPMESERTRQFGQNVGS
ncbi:hypothetical protein F5884DRAFT_857746 [Xylogone sp. PMI_703]|nr:hypothetical protein F5884DRAFT_857746 [Xylogone sp. PMI_703]